MSNTIKVLDHGFITLHNLSGPIRRAEDTWTINQESIKIPRIFDADDIDPAMTARISFDNLNQERTKEQDLKLVEYLIQNRHNTPIEMIEIWLEMKLPIFVARQFVRHRTATINEVSARYTKLPEQWYIPNIEVIGYKSKSNKQGRDIIAYKDLDKYQIKELNSFRHSLNRHCSIAYEEYIKFLDMGIAPELARCFLHVNHYTHWVWKQDLSNMMHFLSLRLHEHAQYEARIYAQAIYDLLKLHLPATMEFFDKYKRI